MLGTFYYIVGTITILSEIVRRVRRFARERVTVPWNLVSVWIDKLYDQLSETELPDLIIGLGRGGAVVAGMISTKYRDDSHHRGRVIPIATIDRAYIQRDVTGQRDTIIVGVHNLDVYGKRVLLLNADTFTGTTLDLARKALEYGEPAQLKTGSLVIFNHPLYKPDFYGESLPLRKRDRRLPWRTSKRPETVASLQGPPTLVILNGLVATGKTSVVNSLVKKLAYTPIYSDWYWFKHGLHDRASNPVKNIRHYQHMMSLCWSVAAMDQNVVLDTTSYLKEIRDEMHSQALRYGIHTVIYQMPML